MAKWYDNDDFLLQRLKANDQKAIEFLYRQYQLPLLKTSLRIVGNIEQARDITQEVFAEVWGRRHGLHISTSFKSYLFRAVFNRSLNFIRDHPAAQTVSLKAIRDELYATAANDASSRLEEQELERFVEQVVHKLPPQCKTMFLLSRKEKMSYKEIAEMLGVSVKAVEKQLSKAMKKVRDSLDGYLKSLIF